MKNVEIEYKVMVNKDDFIKLENILSNIKYDYYIQTNHYYDTKDNKLKDNKYSLRIRYIENLNKYVLTLKVPHLEGKEEYEYKIKSLSINNINKTIKNILNKINVNNDELIKIGQLKTIRKEYKINDCLLCLDHSFYNQKEDYEIECEANNINIAKNVVVSLLKDNNIEYEKSKYSKTERAIKNI